MAATASAGSVAVLGAGGLAGRRGQVGFVAIGPLYPPGGDLGSPSRHAARPGRVRVVAGPRHSDARTPSERNCRRGAGEHRRCQGVVLASTPIGAERRTRGHDHPGEPHMEHRRRVPRRRSCSRRCCRCSPRRCSPLAVGLSLRRNMRQTDELRAAALSVRQTRRAERAPRRRRHARRCDRRGAAAAGVRPEPAGRARSTSVTAWPIPSSDGHRAGHAAPHRRSMPPGGRRSRQPCRSPITDAWNTRTPVFVADEAAFRGLYADGLQPACDARSARRRRCRCADPMAS